MSTETIYLEAERIVWDMPIQKPDGSLVQHTRIYDGAVCRVHLIVNFPANSIEAREWALCAARVRTAQNEAADKPVFGLCA